MNWLILFLGLCVIVIGRFEVYLTIIDILTWVNTLYFVNINCPLNIRPLLLIGFMDWYLLGTQSNYIKLTNKPMIINWTVEI